ncbi:ATP-binding cassette domain-containing protein [Anaerocolumna sedimenticola]|uniref:ATP-binding cassette domain-containing protein n=1 Tax=Anaerocolumna sedimenticola TaxID=2696063 RepID=A0A6P1TIK7_9FIRM|nr:ABC transporter ATP-binding protein [Anaerocolumna sedimenticola]QHQ61040.1 ATP-binding cassette domain-containing protein [Anaerocolumna sedimenticola]
MLNIKNLTKTYGKFIALDNLKMEIKKGEIFGFVGPNGAGKTTTMRIIAGLLKSDSGEVFVDGINARTNLKELKNKIGYMPDFFGVYDNLKALEYMEFYASIYGITGNKARRLCLELMDLVRLSDQADSYVDEMSRGMKQRLCLARSMVHDPELLILDEPASGLDPRARVEMKEILRELHDKGKTILISSHILPELAQLCSNIGIIEKGKMVLSGTVEEILSIRGVASPIVMKFTANQEKAVEVLKQNPLVQNIIIRDNSISILFKGKEAEEANILAAMIGNGALLSSFAREESNLESLFMQITTKEE